MKESNETEIYLINTFGREVLHIFSGQLEMGQHTIEVTENSLTSGMYVCVIETPSWRKVLKILKS